MTVGARFIAVGARDVIRAGASTEWPYVTGLVLDSGVERRQHRSRVRPGTGRTSIIYYPKVIYQYSVQGTSYSGDRIEYGTLGKDNPAHAERIVENYPKGKYVRVYYMPGQVTESILVPGITLSTWFRMGFGFAFFSFGMLVLYAQTILRKNIGVRNIGTGNIGNS